jgi:predicted amidohydrolase YtcJ
LNTGLWKHWLRIIGTFVIFGTSLIAKRVEAAECAGADLVVQHAHIITMDSFRRMAAALAVRGGTIVAVGSDPEIARCIEAHTKVLDLAGRTVLPGLIDVHTHAILWAEGVLRNEIDLTYPDVKTIPDVIAAVQKRAASVSAGVCIQGIGWDDAKLAEHRYITRQDLDAVSPNNPVYLEHVTGHLGVANGAALKIAGIAPDTPNPVA